MMDPTASIPSEFTLDDLDKLQVINEQDPRKIVAVRFGLMMSFYLRDAQSLDNRLAMAKCADYYQELVGTHIKSFMHPYGDIGPYPAGGVSVTNLLQENDNPQTKPFCVEFFGDEDHYVAAPYGFSCYASESEDPILRETPAYLTAVLPFSWLKGKSGEGAFQDLVNKWCQILKPFHGYAGVGAIRSMDMVEQSRTKSLVYPFARRFPGLEIESTSLIASMIKKNGHPLKIKGVNWLTALDDKCLEPIGGRKPLLDELDEGFTFYEYDGGILIQSGLVPQIGDVNQRHMPRYYQELARKLKPLRFKFVKGNSLIPSPDRMEKSNEEVSNEWLARFD